MLFFEGDAPKTEGEDKTTASTTKGLGPMEQLEALETAMTEYVVSKDMGKTIGNINKQLTTMEDSSLALQRSMGGVAFGTAEFRDRLQEAFKANLDMNAEFKDAVDVVAGLATEMGKIVNPSSKVTQAAIEFSKATFMSGDEVGKMIGQFTLFGGSQEDSIKRMSDLGKSARRSGLDAKSFTQEVAKNLKQASLYGFKNGIDDLEKMVKKVKVLGTSFEKLGIKGAADSILDPEKALEVSSSLQMIGGNVGALADPFQLMYMGQKDMKKLTDEVLNMAKASFTFDKATGSFTQTTEDMYAMKAAAQSLGISYEEASNAGKELAKQDFIKGKIDLKGFDDDTQNLISSLSQIDKDGNIKIDIPGFEEGNQRIEDLVKDQNFKDALKEYQDKASKSDRDLALEQMSIAEKQNASVNKIQYAVFAMLSDEEEKTALQNIEKSTREQDEIMTKAANDIAPATKTGLETYNAAAADAAKKSAEFYKTLDPKSLVEDVVKNRKRKDEESNENDNMGDDQSVIINENDEMGGGNGGTNNENDEMGGGKDMFFPPGNTPIIESEEGKFYKSMTKNDGALFSPDIDKIFQRAQSATNILSEVMGQNTTSNVSEMKGKIDFGTLTVKIDAPNVDTKKLEQTLNGQQFIDHIMNMVNNGSWDRKQGNIGK